MNEYSVQLAGNLLAAGATRDEAAAVAASAEPEAAKRSAAVLAGGGTLSEAFAAAGTDTRLVQTMRLLDDHPAPGPLLTLVGRSQQHRSTVTDDLSRARRTWLALALSVLLFSGATALLTLNMSTVALPVMLAVCLTVSAPVALLLAGGYLNVTGRPSSRRPQHHVDRLAAATWAQAWAHSVEAGDADVVAEQLATAIAADVWDVDVAAESLPPQLATARAAGLWVGNASEYARAWAAQATEQTLAALERTNRLAVTISVNVLSAVLTVYVVLIFASARL